MNKTIETYTIAFYNIENLFDIDNNPSTNDDDFLPTSAKRWTHKRYQNKLLKIGTVIPKIGAANTKVAPVIVGLAEVESSDVLSDLVENEAMLNESYSYIHYDSPDERGIDVALLYKSDIFKVENSETYSVYLQKDSGEQDYTRDILLVQGTLNNENLNIIVNHWSSRREGKKETEFKRLAAAKKVNTIIESIRKKNIHAKIIVMGDFNDNPNNESISLIETKSGLYNPFKTIWSYDKGSLNHNFQWHMFDQILFSTNFFDVNDSDLDFSDADVFNIEALTQNHGKYKGQPFRTFIGKKYKGGYSDHFPVFIELKPS